MWYQVFVLKSKSTTSLPANVAIWRVFSLMPASPKRRRNMPSIPIMVLISLWNSSMLTIASRVSAVATPSFETVVLSHLGKRRLPVISAAQEMRELT